MNIENVAPDELTPYEKNPRQNNEAIETVKTSILKHGFNQPIVTNHDGVICVGHTRWEAAKALGLKTVPVYKKKMTEAEFIAYNLADNKSHEYSKWDTDLLSDLMKEIDDLDSDMLKATGFSDEEIEGLLDTSDVDDLLTEEGFSQADIPAGAARASVKMVQIFLNDHTFPKFIDMCEVIQAYMTTDNLSDTIYNAVEKVSDEIKREAGEPT